MIQNHKDYKRYLNSDAHALFSKKPSIIEKLKNPIWKYQRLLRKCEYFRNTNRFVPLYLNILYLYNKFRLSKWGYKLGFSISENVFDEGLSIAHYGTIIVNPSVKVGKNCRIHAGVNIGASVDGKSPMIGDNVYIRPGAKIFGGIILGNNIAVGANAVVNKSFPLGNCTIGGIPAHIISEKDSRLLAVTYYWK